MSDYHLPVSVPLDQETPWSALMTRVTVDDRLKVKLAAETDPVELCDALGHTLGRFLPESQYQRLLHVRIDVPFSPEEIERRRREQGGRSLAEIWRNLESR